MAVSGVKEILTMLTLILTALGLQSLRTPIIQQASQSTTLTTLTSVRYNCSSLNTFASGALISQSGAVFSSIHQVRFNPNTVNSSSLDAAFDALLNPITTSSGWDEDWSVSPIGLDFSLPGGWVAPFSDLLRITIDANTRVEISLGIRSLIYVLNHYDSVLSSVSNGVPGTNVSYVDVHKAIVASLNPFISNIKTISFSCKEDLLVNKEYLNSAQFVTDNFIINLSYALIAAALASYILVFISSLKGEQTVMGHSVIGSNQNKIEDLANKA